MLRTRLILPLTFASVAFLWGCQEQASSPVEPDGPGPQFSAKKCDAPGGDALPGCGGSSDSGEEFEVVLGDGYSTIDDDGTEIPQDPQPIKFAENGRRVIVRTEDGAQIQYSLNILDITESFADASCVWSGLDNANDAGEATTFWNAFLTTHSGRRFRNLLFRVNKKENGFSDGEHRTEARWWIQTETKRTMYLVKVGVPGKVLAGQLSELIDDDFEPATGTFDGTEVTITGGAIRLSEHFCGDPVEPEATAGCGPQAPTQEVACINDPDGDFPQTFTAIVTTKAPPQ